MKDWVLAILVSTGIVAAIFLFPVLAALLTMIMVPLTLLIVGALVVWFLLQMIRDDPEDRP